MSHNVTELRKLLRKDTAWLWTEAHEQEFLAAKAIIANPANLSPFDPSLPTELYCDASKLRGIGYILCQKKPDGSRNIIQCGSSALTRTQANYAIIEIEALALAWSTEHCAFYLQGCPEFDVFTDHKPLIPIFSKTDSIDTLNPRLLKLADKCQVFNMRVNWIAGRDNTVADLISRTKKRRQEIPEMKESCRRTFTEKQDPRQDPALKDLFEAASEDEDYKVIIDAVRAGVKDVKKLPKNHLGRAYSSEWSYLAVLDDEPSTLLVHDHTKILVPKKARKKILEALHVSHQGAAESTVTARK